MMMYPADWPVRLSGAAGGMVGGAIGLFVVKPLIELPVWLGPFAFVALSTRDGGEVVNGDY